MPKASSQTKKKSAAKPGARVSNRSRGHSGTIAARTPVERIYHIHAAISSGSLPNCERLSAELDVTTKTIQRDITYMREGLGLPISYEGTRHGFYYKKQVGNLPIHDLTADELATLFLSKVAMAGIRGSRMAETLSSAFQRIVRPLQDRFSFGWEELDESLANEQSAADPIILDVFQKLAQAVQERREVEIIARKSAADKSDARRFQPLHVGVTNGQWALVGFDLDRAAIRVLPLAAITRVKTGTTKFKRPVEFDARPHLATGFALTSGNGEAFEVKVQIEGAAAGMAASRLWDVSQEIKELNAKGTKIEVKLNVTNLAEATRWVLSLGSGAKVLAPAGLIKAVHEECKLIARNAR